MVFGGVVPGNADCKIVGTGLNFNRTRDSMEIRFVSSLTAEDENSFAPALLKAVSAVLDQLPIAYTLRIETMGAQVFQHTHAANESRSSSESFDGVSSGDARLNPYIAAIGGPSRA
jgi:hypothetical protein